MGFIMLTSVFLLVYGRTDSFTIINYRHNAFFDFFFRFITYLGDGMMWVPLALVALFFRRNWILPVLFAILISTAFVHILKRLIFPEELRPLSLQAKGIYVHTVAGVTTHLRNSFPSGHTGQAFTMALLLVFLQPGRWSVVLFPLLALLVAYSRVYLAQHFVADVLTGMLIGVVSAWAAIQLGVMLGKKKSPDHSV